MKKVYINGRFCTRPVTGVERVAWEVIKEIDKTLKGPSGLRDLFRFTLLIPARAEKLPSFEVIEVKRVGRLKWQFWEQFILPFAAYDGLLVNFCNTAPIFKQNQIVVIHDVAVYRAAAGYSRLFRWFYKIIFLFLRFNVRDFVTVSHFSKREIHNVLGIPQEKIHVIKNGADHMLAIAPDESILTRSRLRQPFVLAVGSRNPNKNFGLVVKAMKDLQGEVEFVVAGNVSPSIFSKGSSNCEKLESAACYLGRVNDAELSALYHNASCFVFPSKYEGFGLPPVEAMYCECPVLASNAAAIPEICGNAALYFDPDNVYELTTKIKNTISKVSVREDLKERGRRRCREYTWSIAAKQFLDLIYQISSA